MSVQQLSHCTFKVGGSYTNNNVFNLKVITHSYNERASRTSRKTAKLTPSESIANLLLEAEHLQKTAKDLSCQLKLTTSSQLEYNDLATTLSEIADETIPCIFRISLDNHQRDVHCQYRVCIEIAYLQGILDEFVKKRTAEHNSAIQGLTRMTTVNAIINLLRSYFEWLFDSQYLVAKIRESLCGSRDRIYLALFKRMISSLGKRVRGYQIDVDDFFGAQWSLPQDLCLNRQVFFSILRFKFQGGPAEVVVASEQFGIFRQDGLKAIQASDWESVIKEGDGLQLSVLVARQSEDMADNPNALECPQCRQSDKTIPGDSLDGWANCLRCNSNFNITPMDSEVDGAQDFGNGTPSTHESLSLGGIEYSKHSMTFRCFSVTISKRKSHRAASQHPVNNCTLNTQKRRREDEPSLPKRMKLDQDVAPSRELKNQEAVGNVAKEIYAGRLLDQLSEFTKLTAKGSGDLSSAEKAAESLRLMMSYRCHDNGLDSEEEDNPGPSVQGPQVAQQSQPGAGQDAPGPQYSQHMQGGFSRAPRLASHLSMQQRAALIQAVKNRGPQFSQPRRLTPQELTLRALTITVSINVMEDAYRKISQGMAPGPEKDARLQGLVRDITARKEAFAKMLTQMAQNGGQLPPTGLGPLPWNIRRFENHGNTQPPRPMFTQATGPSPNIQPSPYHVQGALQQPNLPPNQPGVPPSCSGCTPSQQAPHPPNGTLGGPGSSNNAVGGTPNPSGQLFPFNNSAPNATMIPSPSAPGVQPMASGGSPGLSAWPPPLEKQKFDAAYQTYSAKTGIKHEMRLMHMDGKPIDLYALHVNVMQEGGLQRVHNKGLWSVIAGRMGFVNFPGSDTEPAKSGPAFAQCLSQVYKEYLWGFDQVWINSVMDNRRKMQTVQAGNGAAVPNMPIDDAIRGQPGAPGVPRAAGPGGAAAGPGPGLKPPFNNPVPLTKPMQFASLPLDQLRNRGLPEHMIQFVDQNRSNIQRASQQSQMRQAAAAVLRAQVEQTPGGQPQKAPGIMAIPTPEQIQIAQNVIARLQHDFRQRKLPTFRPFELPSQGRVEYQSMFQRLVVQVDNLNWRMPYLYYALRSEDSMRKIIAMVMTVKYQQQLLTSGNSRVVITPKLLCTMLVQVKAADNTFIQYFVNKEHWPQVLHQICQESATTSYGTPSTSASSQQQLPIQPPS